MHVDNTDGIRSWQFTASLNKTPGEKLKALTREPAWFQFYL
jgi:hypothetical protein